MKKNPVKAALREGKPSVGTWLSFGDVLATRLMARVGFPARLGLDRQPFGLAVVPFVIGAWTAGFMARF